MAFTQLRSDAQLKDNSINLVKMSDDFLQGQTWTLSSDNSALLTGLADPVGTHDAVTKTYVDGIVNTTMKSPDGFATTAGGDYPSDYKASGEVNEGDTFYITDIANGALVGAITVEIGDMLVSKIDNPGNTDSNWIVMQANKDQASEIAMGMVELATQTETDTGTDAERVITPKTLQGYVDNNFLDKTAGTGMTETNGTFNVNASDDSMQIDAGDLHVKIGSTNGSSLETTATGVELLQTVTGQREFSQATGETFKISNTDANSVTLGTQPDGTVDLSIATTKFVKDNIPDTIYSADGTLAGNRAVNTSTFDLGFSGTGNFQVQSSVTSLTGTTSLELQGNSITSQDQEVQNAAVTTSIPFSITATADYGNGNGTTSGDVIDQFRADFTDDALINAIVETKAIADSAVSAIVTSDNGLTKTGTNIQLGGDLTKNTEIDTKTFTLNIKTDDGSGKSANLDFDPDGVNVSLSAQGSGSTNSVKADADLGISIAAESGKVEISSVDEIKLDAGANKPVLTNQPDGTVDLAISTTKYVDDKLSALPTDVYNELPAVTDGSANVDLANTPSAGTERVHLNGVRQTPGSGNDYTISGTTITFTFALQTGDAVLVDYKY